MGLKLTRWAYTIDHPGLTNRTRQVLINMCMVSYDNQSEFEMRGREFIYDYLPDMSYGAYKNHLSALVRIGLLTKVQHGGGRTINGRGTVPCFRINSPWVWSKTADSAPLSARNGIKKKETYNPWDCTELLGDDETIIEYLKDALEEEDPAFLKNAVHNVVRAKSVKATTSRRVGPA